MYNTSDPRPTEHSQTVLENAAVSIREKVEEWADTVEMPDTDIGQDLREAFLRLNDPFHAALYLHDARKWPVDADLVHILSGGYRSLRYIAALEVMKWVMESGTRFPAKKGHQVRFRISNNEYTGVVGDVISQEARALVYVRNMSFPLAVNAEEVVLT